MEILQPIWGGIALVGGLAVAGLLLWLGHRRRQRILLAWLPSAASETDVSPRKRGWRSALLLLVIALLGLGVARPQLRGERVVDVQPGDVILLLDCSRSMLAEDVSPSRFELARATARQLTLEAPARRFGLVAFAGESFVECPLTDDRQMLCLFLDRLTMQTIPLPGTSLPQALAEGGRAAQAGAGASVAMILLTDGEETVAEAEAPRAPEGVDLLVVGVGNPAVASPIPTTDGPLIDPRTGKPATSRPDFPGLRKLATASQGEFLVAGADTVQSADQWLRQCFQREDGEQETTEAGIELYPVLALAALLLLCLRWLLDERRSRVVLAAVAVLFALQATAGIETDYAQALSLLKDGRFSEAVIVWRELAKVPDLPPRTRRAMRLNLGVAQHQLGRELARDPKGRAKALAAYAQAEACYTDCLWDDTQSPRAIRNLARLAQDRRGLTSPPAPPPEEKPEAKTKPPPEGQKQTKAGEGTDTTQKQSATEAAETSKAEAETELTPAETAQAVQTMREQEGDFNEALRRRQARSWRTIPPKRPW